jgi:hypothetical protein
MKRHKVHVCRRCSPIDPQRAALHLLRFRAALAKEGDSCRRVVSQDARSTPDVDSLRETFKGESSSEGLPEELLVDIPTRGPGADQKELPQLGFDAGELPPTAKRGSPDL